MKNILKKQILWAIPLAFSLLTSSCSDYLDKLPENTVEVEGIDYTNKSNMYMPVSGVYATARGYLGSWSSYGCIIVRGDDVNKGGSPTDQIEYEYASKFQYDRLTTFWALSGLWGNCYYVVSTSNSALESLENYAKHLTSESDKQLNAQYAAEVRFSISGWAFIEPTEKIRNLFSKRGEAVRAETTFLMTDATTRDGDYIPVAQPGEPTAYNGKAYTPANQMTPGRTGYGDNNNIRVFRYADVLLMNAEAKVRKGQNGDAPLNLVRERAGLAPIANATLDQILEERQVELALEWGERFFDLVRTDRATQELPGFVKGESEYYPIPQDQIDLNPNLEAEPVPFEPEVTE